MDIHAGPGVAPCVTGSMKKIKLDSMPTTIQQQIIDAANQYGVPPSLALAVAQQESNFNPSATASNKNAQGQVTSTDYGIFQLNSKNLNAWGVTNPLDPTQNIDAGVSFLAQLLQQYQGNATKALEAYNGGPGAATSGSTANYAASVLNLQNNWTDYDTPDTTATAPDPAATDPTDPEPTDTEDATDPTPYLIGGAILLAALYALAQS